MHIVCVVCIATTSIAVCSDEWPCKELKHLLDPTNKPAMIFWDDDPDGKQAKLPCSHAQISPDSLATYCRSVLTAGKSSSSVRMLTKIAPPSAAIRLHRGGSVAPPVGIGTYQDWLVAWKEWARTRKRGKMAQFIGDKLEDSKQARWLNIADGKLNLPTGMRLQRNGLRRNQETQTRWMLHAC